MNLFKLGSAFSVALAVFIGCGGCTHVTQLPPAPPATNAVTGSVTIGYGPHWSATFSYKSITNGCTLLFDTVPSDDLAYQMAWADATVNPTNICEWHFDAVDTDDKVQAVHAALLAGAIIDYQRK